MAETLSAPARRVVGSRIAACESTLRTAGAICTHVSDYGSRYFGLPDGRRVRVADHCANGVNHGLPDARWDAEIRVDLADWRDSLAAVAACHVAVVTPMPAHVYFSDCESVSQSMLKTFMDRRRLYEAYFVTGTAEPPPPTDPMRKGTATHTAILEPDRFEDLVITYPADILASNGAVSTKEAKAFRDEHLAAGRVVLKESEAAQVRAMADSVRRVCGKWLDLPGKKEQSVYWTDEISGLQCKARLDWLIEKPDRNFLFDLKSTNDASPAAFRRRVEDGRYYLQADHYCAGVEAALDKPTSFIFVAVETAYPHAVALYELDSDSIAGSIVARRSQMNHLADCLKSGDFSEPWERQVNPLQVREWAFSPNGL